MTMCELGSEKTATITVPALFPLPDHPVKLFQTPLILKSLCQWVVHSGCLIWEMCFGVWSLGSMGLAPSRTFTPGSAFW